VARLVALREVALALSGSLVLSESGPPALAALLRASRTHLAALYVREAAGDQLVCIASVGFDPEGPGPPPVVSMAEDSLARRAIQIGGPHYSGDGTEVPAASQARMVPLGVQSFVSLPIIGQGQVIGSLILLARAPRRFSRADITFLESAANQIALSVENGRLYQHTRALLAEVEHSNQLKDEFISIASHELRTPLTAVRGYAEMMLRRLRKQPDREADLKSLATIYVQVDRMNRLIADLLDVSRMTGDRLELRPQRLDLGTLVRHVLEQQQPLAPQHPFTASMDPPAIVGLWDGPRLEQVLLNLLNNAVKYTPQGGPVAITLRGDSERGRVTVTVRDEGIGIPPESLTQLFTRFYRAPNARLGRGGGLGIGLYVSHQIVRAHGGDIVVESLPGVGTTFTIQLPWRHAAPLA
jgi:signal transduction histidine kinase